MARWDRHTTNEIPDWFWRAVESPSTEHSVEIDECDVVYRKWNGNSESSILFLHGMFAHSRWWDFIAPHFTGEYAPIALDFTGMGDSDHRYEYSIDTCVDEILGVATHAGLNEKTILVGHSFGGRMATKVASLFPQKFAGLVLVDSGMRAPSEPERNYMQAMPGTGRSKTYPSREEAESRFRLFPPQPCKNPFVMHYIAKNSVSVVEGGGYTWKFDPDLPLTFRDSALTEADYRSLKMPVSVIFGADSDSYTADTNEFMTTLVPEPFHSAAIPDAGHHVFLDQPLRFVEELQKSLCWIESESEM